MASISSSSPLAADLNKVVNRPPGYKPYFLFSTMLHTAAKDLDENNGVIIASVREEEDYVNQTTTYLQISLMVKLGTLVYDIYPYADDLELTLGKVKQSRWGSDGLESYKFECRYKALYLLDKNIELPTELSLPRETLDKQGYVTIDLQLVDINALALRNSYVQGHFSDLISPTNKNMSYDSLMQSVLSTAIEGLELDSRRAIDRVNIEKPDNEEPIKAVTIPTGTLALDVPSYFQENLGGVYVGDIGTFIKHYSEERDEKIDRVLFVYSVYNRDKFENEENKIVFLASPDPAWNTVDHTYTYRTNVLKIMTHPTNGPNSTKGTVLRDEGEGFRSGSASVIMDSPLEFTEEGPKFKKTTWLTELTDKPQEDGLDNIPYKGINNNHFVNAAEILSRKGEYIVLRADNIDTQYVTPGAGCQVTYQPSPRLIRDLYGVIHKSVTIYEPQSFDMTSEINRKSHALFANSFFTIYLTDF